MILDDLIKTVVNVFDAHTAALLAPVKKRENEPLCVLSWHSLSNNFNPEAKINKGEGLIAWVYKEQKPFHFNHFEKDPQLLKIYDGELQIKAIMMAPLPDNMGALLVDSKNRYAFPEKSIKLLSDFAQLSYELLVSLEQKAELYFFRRYKEFILDENKDLNSIIFNLINLTGLDKVFFALKKQNEKTYTIICQYNIQGDASFVKTGFNLGDGLTGWVFNNKKSIFLSVNQKKSSRTFILNDREKLPDYNYYMGIYLQKDNNAYCFAMFGNKKKSGVTSRMIPLLEKALGLIIKENNYIGD